MKYLIIHRSSVEISQGILSEEGQKEAKKTLATIDEILKEMPEKCVRINSNQRDIGVVSEYFEKGEEVILCGAYLGMCLYVAHSVLVQKGVKVGFHPTGCI